MRALAKTCLLVMAALIALLAWIAWSNGKAAQSVSAAPSFAWPSITPVQVVSGLSQPTFVTNAGDASGRIFVAEQGGRIRIIKAGVLQATPFLDITSRVRSGGEQGLLSMAFPPDYASTGFFYGD